MPSGVPRVSDDAPGGESDLCVRGWTGPGVEQVGRWVTRVRDAGCVGGGRSGWAVGRVRDGGWGERKRVVAADAPWGCE